MLRLSLLCRLRRSIILYKFGCYVFSMIFRWPCSAYQQRPTNQKDCSQWKLLAPFCLLVSWSLLCLCFFLEKTQTCEAWRVCTFVKQKYKHNRRWPCFAYCILKYPGASSYKLDPVCKSILYTKVSRFNQQRPTNQKDYYYAKPESALQTQYDKHNTVY